MAAGRWGADPMAVEESALLLFASALAYAEPGIHRADRRDTALGSRSHPDLPETRAAHVLRDVRDIRQLGCHIINATGERFYEPQLRRLELLISVGT